MTDADFRKLALSLPEVEESSHMGHPDFRVRGKIFATLWSDGKSGMAKLTPEQQEEFVRSEPDVFAPVNGSWGRRGATQVRLTEANRTIVRRALIAAWRNTAPKSLTKTFDEKL